MNELTAAKSASVDRVPDGFEEKLIWLCKFGVPRVSRHGDGWYSAINMNTNTTGSQFKVETAFDCKTPSESVDQLIQRMLEALSAIGVR